MLRRSVKVGLATGGVVAVLGSGVALAADTSVCPWGNAPRSAPAVSRTQASGDRAQQRQRDGTGLRHAQQSQRREHRGGRGQRPGNGGANCPYRS